MLIGMLYPQADRTQWHRKGDSVRIRHAAFLLLIIACGVTEVSGAVAPAVDAERKADSENLFVLIAALITAMAAIVAAYITGRGPGTACECRTVSKVNYHYHSCPCTVCLADIYPRSPSFPSSQAPQLPV